MEVTPPAFLRNVSQQFSVRRGGVISRRVVVSFSLGQPIKQDFSLPGFEVGQYQPVGIARHGVAIVFEIDQPFAIREPAWGCRKIVRIADKTRPAIPAWFSHRHGLGFTKRDNKSHQFTIRRPCQVGLAPFTLGKPPCPPTLGANQVSFSVLFAQVDQFGTVRREAKVERGRALAYHGQWRRRKIARHLGDGAVG